MNSAKGNAPAEWGDEAVSPREEALSLLDSLAPGIPVHNRSAAFAVDGHLDPARLDTALTAVLRRHEALRTVYRDDRGRLVKRVVGPDDFRLDVAHVVLPGGPTDGDLAAVAAVPFDLDGGPMLRVALLHSPDTDLFCVTAHHLVFDEVSASVFLEELAAAYGHEHAYAAEPDADFGPGPAHGEAPESLAFWRQELAGADPAVQELACTAPEPSRPTLAAARAERILTPRTVAAARRLAESLAVPESAVLLAAYCVLLETHGAGPDLLMGSPVDVRPDHAARTIGHHVTHVPLRLRVDREESVRELVRRSAECLVTAVAHADVAVETHPDLLPAPRSARRPLPFRHVFEHQAGRGPAEFTLGGLTAEPVPVASGCGKFDLDLCVTSTQDRASMRDSVSVRAVYRSELFERSVIDLLLARYEAVLVSFTEGPGRAVGDVSWWSERDHEIVGAANDTARPVEPASVLDAVYAHAVRMPDAVAVVDGERLLGYGQLWNAAHAVSALVRDTGIRAGDVVAIALPRGPELVAAVLGTWLAGAAYLPLDAAHPEERIRYQLSDSAARALVTTEDMAHYASESLVVLTTPMADTAPPPTQAGTPPAAPPATPDPASCAYLIYTSGSTGRPKGTLITHAALANVAAHFAEQLEAEPGDTMLWTTTFAFDMSGIELHVPLVSGGRLVAAPDSARSDGRVLRELVERYGARFVEATPTTWRLVIDRMEDCLRGRGVIVGGEPVPVSLARRLVAAGCVLHHAYGPTETAIWSTSRVVKEALGARLDVGRPIRNTQVQVVDEHGRELPVGVRGELCISGTGVAIGYHGRPELNAQRFGEHPAYGRFYRTGDVACWRTDGSLDLFGRSDRQVKLRGNRIELGEIESTLLAHPEVGAAAVIMAGDPTADAVLIGCLEPAAGSLDTGSVLAHARARLSRAMLPGDLITVDPLPINANGKTDYPALERMVADRRTHLAATRLAPHPPDLDELTARLTALWGTLLQREDVDADTNFFTYGGNSMLAAMAMQELQDMSGVSLSLTEVFERPTPRELAARVKDMDGCEVDRSG
ncbi:amino acid adenylation domain-containing protein [Streptomyces sp. NPDC059818]|uniref:non-ribosomal peptide synthetase n=1 Tax=Streptomyces sp. NPDC059818 TaxID=3346962 RepID=UPI00364A9E91